LLDLHTLSSRHDLRPLVLRTALTYLELAGTLRQGTPLYLSSQMRPLTSVEEVIAGFAGERQQFVRELFAHAKEGRIWFSISPKDAALAMGQPRERIEQALDYFQEKGLAEVRRADVRHRYTVVRRDVSPQVLAADLFARFRSREAQDIARVAQVIALVTASACQTNMLCAHFGEQRPEPCGHCTFCRSHEASVMPRSASPSLPAISGDMRAALADLDARQSTRFLCGLSSPHLSKRKLTHHALFGALRDHRFAAVLALVSEIKA
jgi:ATP-dependent DNA helicase RecQ